ncbi:MAG: DNA repair protein RecO [Deltaproteobacteria bacterium]|nr:DNA repair protein RecO [Deltaproteobacteria bacterium]MBW2019727.1 DNA repair protein RecO [Deltaproteobacteria bacterium]MBW2073928.1 DNA repair protein RecO [Deltaproteobacteria bacterium]RLB81474.1 MAG: DNA repair protein RecO [Deltaproteobacteria bacterium]
MPHLSSPAILLRAIEHGDYDKVITFFTIKRGKISIIAKGAKKSIKRFAGVLELFSVLNLVWTYGRRQGLPILQEASMVHPFDQIRTDITKTAYASYWCELVYAWMEQGQKNVSVYELLEHTLDQLNSGGLPEHILHITFQLRFVVINGFKPNLDHCTICRTPLERFGNSSVTFGVRRGGILCEKCVPQDTGTLSLSKGTVKLLRWILNAPIEKLNRLRFSRQAIKESLRMLEAFVPYYLGKETKSLKFLKQIDSKLPH